MTVAHGSLTTYLRLQGNADLYTDEAIKQRHDLRTDAALMNAVRSWWR
jgi:hypothetical protein